MRRVAERFVAGVNARVEAVRARPPLEFALAGLQPEHWAPEDLLARAEAFGMSGNAQSEVSRARLVQRYGITRRSSCGPPILPWRGACPRAWSARGGGRGAGGGARRHRGRPEVRRLAQAGKRRLRRRRAATTGWWRERAPPPAGPCSRTIPTAPSTTRRSATSFTSRRRVCAPSAPWCPGSPGIAIGHNERIGWGLTIFGIDAQDLFQETLDPARMRSAIA